MYGVSKKMVDTKNSRDLYTLRPRQ